MGLLDLVALGTVADVAALHGLNRAFVAQGLKVLARRADHGDLLAELTGFGVRCVARRDDLPAGLDGIEGLDDSALHGLRHSAAQLVIL